MLYEIAPRNTVEIRVVPPQDPPEVVVKDDDLLSVWCQGFAAVFIDGVDVDKRLPTKADLSFFESDEYKGRVQRDSERLAAAEESRKRYEQEHPEEFRRVMSKVVAAFQDGARAPTDFANLLSDADEELVDLLRASGIIPIDQ